jgi:radical SAM superfamily enzyme YgiQ (UPF0313 family)
MALSVYLADLRHNYGGVLATDCMPLSVGYMKAVMDARLHEATSRIFAYPGRLIDDIVQSPPDVLMLSNYVWNCALSLRCARLARELRPDMLIVMGGPNLSNQPQRQLSFLHDHPVLDLYVLGEGDFLATTIVERLLQLGSRQALLEAADLPSCLIRQPDGTVLPARCGPRESRLNEIPSPWLTGIMDQFFDGRLAPMIETNRGCPFRCSFCVQGTDWYTKVHYFDTDRLQSEIDYIGQRIQRLSPAMGTLRIADANYGMYERDVELSRHIGQAQARYGWPTFIDATTGKNKPDRILKSLEEVSGALVLYQAVQSLDEDVLRNVRRSNIKLAAYQQIQMYMRGRGLKSNSDLILGLPGESLQSHLRGLYTMIDTGVNQMHCFQAMVLKGSDLETDETRDLFRFDTRFRVLPKNYGVYADEKVFDIEEIVVATDTLPFEDYLTCRKHHLAFSVFWNDGWFEPLVSLSTRYGAAASAWLQAMVAAMQSDGGEVSAFVQDFIDETCNELFPTAEACQAFYAREENFARLQQGDVGDNLMYKYRARASFFDWSAICRCAVTATRRLLSAHAPQIAQADDRFWSDLQTFLELRHASGRSLPQILAPCETQLTYDIGGWLAEGAPADWDRFRWTQPTLVRFQLPESSARELESAFQVWSSRLTGLSKLVTRIKTSSQIRDYSLAADALAPALSTSATESAARVAQESTSLRP